MKVEVIPSIHEAEADQFAGKTAIVIDVLRATSTMVAALAAGCKGIVPVETIEQAKKAQAPGDLLGGERFCQKIPGFDLGNSPLEYRRDIVGDKIVVMTTTNGTRAIQTSLQAETILAGSLLNGAACAAKALESERDIVILCSGTNDVFSLEDGLCAGLLAAELSRLASVPPEFNDVGLAMMYTFERIRDNMTEAIFGCSNGKRLSRLGFSQDIVYCSQVNRLAVVPEFCMGVMKQH